MWCASDSLIDGLMSMCLRLGSKYREENSSAIGMLHPRRPPVRSATGSKSESDQLYNIVTSIKDRGCRSSTPASCPCGNESQICLSASGATKGHFALHSFWFGGLPGLVIVSARLV